MQKLILTTILIFSVQFSFSQDVNGWTFECGGYSFKVWDDDTPIEYSFRSGDRISRDWNGRVEKIGNVRISRDWNGKIDKIGGMRLNFDWNGRFEGSTGSIGCNW